MGDSETAGPGRSTVLRTRLLELLRSRFEPGLTLVIGGPGFGKTTALRQAVAENELAPAGTDRYLAITPAMRRPHRLAAAVADALDPDGTDPAAAGGEDGDHDPADVVDRALQDAARRWPLGVALLIDDAHLLDGAESEPLLRTVFIGRPLPVHLVVAGRHPPRVLAGLRTPAPTLTLAEHQLRFDAVEVEELAVAHGVAGAELSALGGWPALTDLATTFGVAGAVGYVEDEVISRLGPEDRAALAAISLVGGGDADLLSAAAGRPVDAEAFARRLPLTELVDGQLVVHAIWHRLLVDDLDAAAAVSVHRRVGRHLLEAGALDDAADHLAAGGDWEGLEQAIAATWRQAYLGRTRQRFADWLELLPDDRRDGPAGAVLRAVAARSRDSFGDRSRQLLDEAVELAQAEGRQDLELVALGELGFAARSRGDREALVGVFARLGELAGAGVDDAAPFLAIAEAALHEAIGDDEAAVATVSGVDATLLSPEWEAAAAFLELSIRARLGHDREAEAAARRCSSGPASQAAVGRYARPITAWYLGRPDEALEALPDVAAETDLARVELAVAAARCALIWAFAGEVELANAHLDLARSALGDEVSTNLAGLVASATAACQAAGGDEAEAARTARHRLEAGAHERSAMLRVAVALHYVLLPEVRSELDELDLGPVLVGQRALGRAVVAVRAGRTIAVDDLPPPDLALTALPVPWTIELASALAEVDPAAAQGWASRLAEVHGDRGRAALRRAAAVDGPGGVAASALLASITVEPEEALELVVLGPVALRRAGRPVIHPDWDRDLVRSLACLLALCGPMDRTRAAATLWPDAAPEVAARNLRQHLALLRGVLEPGRGAGEPSFLLREDPGAGLSLAGPPHLEVDALRFAELLDEPDPAGRDRGAHVDAALARWVGRPLGGLPELDWIWEARDQLTARYVSAAVRRGRDHLAGSSPQQAVVHAIDLLQVDPWSEEAYQLLVGGYLAIGDRAAARRALERARSMLDELGAAPAPDTLLLERRLS